MRIRTLKPEFWSDEKLSGLPALDRLVFLGLISMADDAGRVLDNLKRIDAFIFPNTDDSARESVAMLAALGRLRRGVTASGQPVIEVVGWSKHQKIDRPNLRAALPPIHGEPAPAFDEPSTRRRRRLAEAVVTEVWTLAEGRCAGCGVTCVRGKADKYDSRPVLGEVDHIIALADGGTDDPQNLQLLCLSCNRTKAGTARSTRNRRRLDEPSSTMRRTIPTTNDQRPTTVADAPASAGETTGIPWSQTAVALYQTHVPHPIAPGRITRVLKPFVAQVGADELLRRWAEYCKTGRDFGLDGKGWRQPPLPVSAQTPERFRDTFAEWGKPAGEAA